MRHDLKVRSYLIIHVDDILLATNNTKEAEELEVNLKLYLKSQNGKITNYLGTQIEKDKYGIYRINQEKHTEQILNTYRLKDAKRLQ